MTSHGSSLDATDAIGARKQELRRAIRARRKERLAGGAPEEMPAQVAERLAWWAMVRGAGTVAAYASFGTEPESYALLDALREDSIRVLLPRWNADDTLEWTPYVGREGLVVGEHGIPEPDGPRYGPHALLGVDFVIVPALAVDRDGHRLGQGRGCYDRALTRLRDDVPIMALLNDDELLPAGSIPAEAHDVRVTHVATPSLGLTAVGTSEEGASVSG
jgi:5-formyltetrahydrofolate cyclo-ligase